jgi:zinc transporter, ZIP family
MLKAIALGTLAQSALLLSGLLVYWIHFPPKFVGVLAGFGAGALIEAVAFDLVAEAKDLDSLQFAVWMLVGASILLIGDRIVEKRFGDEGGGGAMGIVVGSMVDGVPESAIFGIQVATGYPITVSFFAAVFISNFPQAIAPSADLAKKGWKMRRVAGMWALVLVSCGVASGLGYLLANTFSGVAGDRMAALAGGGLLAMLTNSLMPFAFERGGQLAGVGTVLGFCIPLMFS